MHEVLRALALRYVAQRVAHNELAASNLKNLRWVLTNFTSACPTDPNRLRRWHVERWMTGQHVAPSTLRTRLSIVRTFCRWLVLNGYATTDATLGIRGPRRVRHLPRAMDAEHVARVLEACTDSRARLIVCLMVSEGLRCAEVAALQAGDIDRRERMMLVRGKGDVERYLPITDVTLGALTVYLAEHPPVAGPLVRSFSDSARPLEPATVSRAISRLMRAAGVKRCAHDGVSAHALRHTAASDVLEAGADVRQVQAMLGHQSLLTTQRYLRRVDARSLLPVMNGRHYRRTRGACPGHEEGTIL